MLSLVGGAKASLLVMIMMVGTLYDSPHGSLTASLDQTTGRCSEKTMVNQGCFRCLGSASRVLCSIWCTLSGTYLCLTFHSLGESKRVTWIGHSSAGWCDCETVPCGYSELSDWMLRDAYAQISTIDRDRMGERADSRASAWQRDPGERWPTRPRCELPTTFAARWAR